MNKGVDIVIPGILESSFEAIEDKLKLVIPFAKTVHIDLIDGKFAPQKTLMDPSFFRNYSKDLELEVHMMVEEPINYLASFAKAGFRRFIGHIEKMGSQEEFVVKAQFLGEVGLAIDSPTSIEDVKIPFDDLDAFLIMTVKAGESGQDLVEADLSKIEGLKNRIFVPLEVDGGINKDNIRKAKMYGASRFVTTSFIFEGNPQERYKELIGAIHS